jgi:hypothetical protein
MQYVLTGLSNDMEVRVFAFDVVGVLEYAHRIGSERSYAGAEVWD